MQKASTNQSKTRRKRNIQRSNLKMTYYKYNKKHSDITLKQVELNTFNRQIEQINNKIYVKFNNFLLVIHLDRKDFTITGYGE